MTGLLFQIFHQMKIFSNLIVQIQSEGFAQITSKLTICLEHFSFHLAYLAPLFIFVANFVSETWIPGAVPQQVNFEYMWCYCMHRQITLFR